MPKTPIEWADAVTAIADTIPDELGTGRFYTKTEGEGDDAKLVRKEVTMKHDPHSKQELDDVRHRLQIAFA